MCQSITSKYSVSADEHSCCKCDCTFLMGILSCGLVCQQAFIKSYISSGQFGGIGSSLFDVTC
ncbi:hypothetical protein X975_23934, partial [Stegodyphus mimosarum]